ncbi:hypothetical protein N6H18_00765 [Reichenbachiella agarivorans]|uniref:Translation initiation factor IF-2, N-terminal region n=1 Tax=Reichenbachiella agarivorans TaxID=2979464 RepID=A0ABY6CPT4_9BACT|nr:hypothetical protein [Reichenbachiella agarivorans]UXP32507.1 hypothetical protein N6H18_00765 [Reichenbachiella agarivorans]
MRLSSLARKIKVTPTQLSNFLLSEGIELPQNTHTKLSEETIELTLKAHGYTAADLIETESIPEPTPASSPAAVETIEHEVIEEEIAPVIDEITEPTVTEEIEPSATEATLDEETGTEEKVLAQVEKETSPNDGVQETEEIGTETTQTKDYEPIEAEDGTLIEAWTELAARDESVEIIKARKAEALQGLTIKGKIDLPEPKSKETKKEIAQDEKPLDPNKIIYTSGPKRERSKRPSHKNPRNRPQSNLNPVEAERIRKQKEEKRRQEQKLKKEKKARAEFYLSQVKATTQTQPLKKKKSKNKTVKKEKIEGNVIQKFWKWLNT